MVSIKRCDISSWGTKVSCSSVDLRTWGEDKTEIALSGKKSLQVQELTLMVYFLAERPMIIKNCFFFFEARWWIPNGISSGSICAGRLSIHEYLLGFSPLSSKLKKEQVLELIISAQESNTKMDKLLADCLHEARYFSLTEIKKDQYIDLGQPKTVAPRPCCLESD